ncbi:MAG TPA: TonB-dependent receptor plug domain-containing protein, partial [Candidatus Polarisedimenticolia bacterium]
MTDRSGRRTRDPAAAARRAGVFFLFAALLAGVVKPLRAEEAPQGPVERVTVNGQGETAAPLDPTAFATVIHAEDFADRLTSVEELMREAVGVSVQSLGGAYATVSVRGSTAEQVVVYLDGVPLNRALGGAVNLADLSLSQVESIEI